MTARIRRRFSRAVMHLQVALRLWQGEDEYERYVRRCADGQQQPLDRGGFFAQRLEERYRSASRCC